MFREIHREYRPGRLVRVCFVLDEKALGMFQAETWEGGWTDHSKAVLTLYPHANNTWQIHDLPSFLKAWPTSPELTVTVRWNFWPDEEEWRTMAVRLASAFVPVYA